MPNNYCLILAGGNGSRLWPVSTTSLPKQFIDFFGTGRTLLQQTYDRVARFIQPDHIYISTNVEYLPLVHEQLPQVLDEQILEEPVRRGTLASVAWGTVVIAKANPKANIFVTPADHIIQKEEEYQTDIETSLSFVQSHQDLLVIGIKPSRAETGYGYIQVADENAITSNIFPVKSFTEKPNAEFAQIFLQEGTFLWNSGLFAFNANVMLSNLYQLVPEYQIEIPRMMAEAESATPLLVPEFFNSLPNRNVDVSILQRSDRVVVLEGHFGWADIGSWNSLYEDSSQDPQGNVSLNAQSFLYECKNNIICLPKGKIVAVKGLEDYVIAEEGNMLMICPKEDIATMRKMHIDSQFQ